MKALLAGIAFASALLAAPDYASSGIVQAWPKAQEIRKAQHELLLEAFLPPLMCINVSAGRQRPELLGSGISSTATSVSSQTYSITPPAGTTLLLLFNFIHTTGAGSHSVIDATWNGERVPSIHPGTKQGGNEIISSVFYCTNPTTGSAQNFIVTLDAVQTRTYCAYMAFKGNTYMPFNVVKQNNSTSATTLTCTTTTSDMSYVVGCAAHRWVSGAGTTPFSGTNLTVETQAATASAMAVALFRNGTPSTSSTGYQVSSAWGAASIDLVLLELRVRQNDAATKWIGRYGGSGLGTTDMEQSGYQNTSNLFINGVGVSTVAGTTHTLTNVCAGIPHANRHILAFIMSKDSGNADHSLSSCTIGGVSTSTLVTGTNNSGRKTWLVKASNVSSGHAVTVAPTFSITIEECIVWLIPTYNWACTVRDSGANTSMTTAGANIDHAAGDRIFFAHHGTAGTTIGNVVWTGTDLTAGSTYHGLIGSLSRMNLGTIEGAYVAGGYLMAETSSTNDMTQATNNGAAPSVLVASITP